MDILCKIKFIFQFHSESIYFDIVKRIKLNQLEIGKFKITIHVIFMLYIHT